MTAAFKQKQANVLQFIKQYVEANGYPPNFDEIKSGCSLPHKSGVHRALRRLQENGLIELTRYKRRGIVLKEPSVIPASQAAE